MALRVSESWIRERVQLKHDNLDDVKSLSLPGTYHEKITSLGNSLRSFTRLKHLDLSRNALTTTEGLETLQFLETLNLYYNNICSLKDLRGLRQMTNMKDLDLRLNPVTKNEPDYRLFIVHMLPNLKRLDDRSVRDSERRAAVMHFTTDQAAEFDGHPQSNGISEPERGSIPRVDMVRGLASRQTALEDDDVQILDLISRTGGDLTQGRQITGSSAHAPYVEDFSREELYRMNHVGTPSRKIKSDHGNVPFGPLHSKPPHKDRVYVHFADERDTSSDPNLKYTDETNAYTAYTTRGHFTPNPRATGHQTAPLTNGEPVGRSRDLSPTRKSQAPSWPDERGKLSPERPLELVGSRDRNQDVGIPLSARSYELSPSSTKKVISSPKQTQGTLADRIGQYEEPGRALPTREHYEDAHPAKVQSDATATQLEMLNKLLDLVDKYWNGSKSLHRHSKFQSLARKLLLSYNVPSSQELSFSTPGQEKLKTELSERTAEISKLRDQTSEQQRELERVRSKLQECEIQQGSLAAIKQEMVSVKSKLTEIHEENGSLRAHIASLEAARLVGGDQAKHNEELHRKNSGLQEQVQSMSQQLQQQNFNLEQLQELTTMLQESHRSLVTTNDHLLKELDETRQRHQNEVHQLHWSYEQLKKSMDWVPTGAK